MKASRKYPCHLTFSSSEPDFGYAKHCSYLAALFRLAPPSPMEFDYALIASNVGAPTTESILSAVGYLFAYYTCQLNTRLHEDGSDDARFILISGIVNALTDLKSGDGTSLLTCSIESINYQQLFSALKSLRLRAIVGSCKEPMIRIINTETNQLMFQIRITKIKSWTANRGHQFNVHLELGEPLEAVLNPTEPV